MRGVMEVIMEVITMGTVVTITEVIIMGTVVDTLDQVTIHSPIIASIENIFMAMMLLVTTRNGY